MKNKTEVFPEDFKLTRKKIKVISAFIDDYLTSRIFMVEQCGFDIPTPKDFAEFMRERAVFLKKIECFYGIETNHRGLWIGTLFRYKNTSLTGYTGLDYDDMPYKGEYIEINIKGMVKTPIWKDETYKEKAERQKSEGG